jgi:hypothetical protein
LAAVRRHGVAVRVTAGPGRADAAGGRAKSFVIRIRACFRQSSFRLTGIVAMNLFVMARLVVRATCRGGVLV